MPYFDELRKLLELERQEDRQSYNQLIQSSSVAQRRESGFCWYPVAIRGTELMRGDYLSVELERTTHQDLSHQLRFGVPAVFFSNHDIQSDRLEGIITHQGGNIARITLRTDELPDWTRQGKLGIELLFDENSYEEMFRALKQASILSEKPEGQLIRVLTGQASPRFHLEEPNFQSQQLNRFQQNAVCNIIKAQDLAIVHGPPGTGKTTTLVQAAKALVQLRQEKILVVAPSNTAVDLLAEKLTDAGLRVLRVGNPARVSERLLALTLDHQLSAHAQYKEIRRLKKQANEYRNLAHKYKRQFGKSEREQRKALFDEAYRILKDVENLENYITNDVIGKADVVAATLVGANHFSVSARRYNTVIVDEAGQALEPACWIPILKADKVVFAGDHCQLAPTIRSEQAARNGLETTLMEKCVQLYPQAVVLLQEQYRMHEQIMHFSSRQFYEGRLKAHETVATRVIAPGQDPLEYIDTAGCGYEEVQEGTAISNPEEAAFTLSHLDKLVQALGIVYPRESFPSIAVISPYKLQVAQLKQLAQGNSTLRSLADKLHINTIDSFQGQERDIVYISLTRSNADGTIGFLSEIRRMNVAMTRARMKLVVIGDSATLSQFPFYADFIAYAEQSSAYKSAWEFLGDNA